MSLLISFLPTEIGNKGIEGEREGEKGETSSPPAVLVVSLVHTTPHTKDWPSILLMMGST